MAEGEKEENKITGESSSENANDNDNEPESAAEFNEKEKELKRTMKPWEQHAAVISIPRFDYNAPSALLNQSHSGFLITCSIKREKSATKEAVSILEKYIGSSKCGTSECLDSTTAGESNKRRKVLVVDEVGGLQDEGLKSNSINDELDGHSKETDRIEEACLPFSLVKLTRSGLLLLTFVGENSHDTVDIVSNIFQCLESGNLKSPLWCHRIFPIQATCRLDEKEMKEVVSKLVLQFMNDKQNKLSRPIKFAVGYNRRGLEETQVKIMKNKSENSNPCPLLERKKCFEIVASAVKGVISDSAVDLKSPELSILVELLPLSGVPDGSLVAAVSVLPRNLTSVKPRLCMKPLVPDANLKNRKR